MAGPVTQQAHARGGSTTIEQTEAGPSIPITLPAGTLRLRARNTDDRHIQWAEDVIDNEHMGKKSSKVCCIYHKPRPVDESSDEDSSDSSSDSDSDDSDYDRARPVGGSSRRHRHNHPHDHDHNHDHSEHRGRDAAPGSDKGKGKIRKPSPNAYEKMPKYSKK